MILVWKICLERSGPVNLGELSQDSWKIQLCRVTVSGVALRWGPKQRAPSPASGCLHWHYVRAGQDLPTSTLKESKVNVLFSSFLQLLQIYLSQIRDKWMAWLIGGYLSNLFICWNSQIFRIHSFIQKVLAWRLLQDRYKQGTDPVSSFLDVATLGNANSSAPLAHGAEQQSEGIPEVDRSTQLEIHPVWSEIWGED